MSINNTENSLKPKLTYNMFYSRIFQKLNSEKNDEVLPLLIALYQEYPQKVREEYQRFCLAYARYHLNLNQLTEANEWLERVPNKYQKAYHDIKALYLQKNRIFFGNTHTDSSTLTSEESEVNWILTQAEQHYLKNEYDQAYNRYTSCSALYTNARLLLAFTQFITSLGQIKEGRKCYNTLTQLISVHRYDMVLLLHHILRREKKYSAAIAVLKKIPVDSGDYRLKALRSYANCHLEFKQTQAAHNTFVTALQEFPTDLTLRENAFSFAEQYQYDDLLSILRETAQPDLLSPASPTASLAHQTLRKPCVYYKDLSYKQQSPNTSQYPKNFMAVMNPSTGKNQPCRKPDHSFSCNTSS